MYRGVVSEDNEGAGALLSPAGPLGVGTKVSIINLGATENQLVETHPKLAQGPLLKHLLQYFLIIFQSLLHPQGLVIYYVD